MSKTKIFLIEGGKALDLIKSHITAANETLKEARRIGRLLGAERIYTDLSTGILLGVNFDGAIPQDFTKPKRNGVSFPKKNSPLKAVFAQQKGFANVSSTISKAFAIPLSVSYASPDGSETGSRCIGSPLCECGFLYMGSGGPYAMWVPDVPAYVSEIKDEGYVVSGKAKNFKMKFESCRQIEDEEWDILVAQYKLKAKKRIKSASDKATK